MRSIILLTITLALLGCGEAPATTTGTGGSGGSTATTTSTTASSGGSSTTSSTSTGEPACVEPTPAGYPDPFASWAGAVDTLGGLEIAPDEANKGMGSAATAVKFGPFACAHDFVGIGVDYFAGSGHVYPETARVAVLFDTAAVPASPPFPPIPTVVERGECATSGAAACASLLAENIPFVVVPVTVHVEPGEVIWPAVEMADLSTGISVSQKAAPDLARAAYYAPPGSKAGDAAPWALLAEPPPGIGVYKFAPVMRLIEGGAK